MEHDVYSIGIVLLELALGRSPITQNGEEKAFNNDVVEEELQPSQVTIVDKVMKSLSTCRAKTRKEQARG